MDIVTEAMQVKVLGPRFLSELTVDAAGVAQIALHGELDMSSADELRETIEQLTALRHPRCLVFDACELDFVDSAGIAVLVYAATVIGDVRVVNPTPQVRRLITVCGLSGVLRTNPN
jgi:stage II sporulation protein AA (anti-sigma F factor antagonist)